MILPLLLTLSLANACSTAEDGGSIIAPPADTVQSALPAMKGLLVYHTYSCYACNDARLYLFDFSSRKRTVLSEKWPVSNPMNAHFSPDGKKIVFMGTSGNTANWDVFLYTIGTTALPLNLTAGSQGRDEDPKFSADGARIVFKRNGVLMEMDTLGTVLKTYALGFAAASMPYYTADGQAILISVPEAQGNTADIHRVSVADGTTKPLSANPDIEEYYPIVRDDTSFLFTRWRTPGNHNDQVYLGYFDGRPFLRLPFNESDQNYSDAYPVHENLVVLSSTRQGGKGNYDLYVADMKTGMTWSLDRYSSLINTAENELGACYWEK